MFANATHRRVGQALLQCHTAADAVTSKHECLHVHACTHPPAHARRLPRVYQAYCPGCATEAVAVHCRQEAGGVYWHDIALLHGTRSPRTSHPRRVIKGSSVPEHDEGARGGREAVRLRHKSERRGRQGSHLIHHAYVADGAVSVRACACVRVCDWYTCIHTYVHPSIDHRVMCKVRLTGITHTPSLSHAHTHTHTMCIYTSMEHLIEALSASEGGVRRDRGGVVKDRVRAGGVCRQHSQRRKEVGAVGGRASCASNWARSAVMSCSTACRHALIRFVYACVCLCS